MTEHFFRHQRVYEVLFWFLWLGINNLVGATSVLMEYSRLDLPLETWQPFTWEYTSAASFLMLLPVVLWFNNRWPIREVTLWPSIGRHALATIPYSLAHVGIMVALRKAIYALVGGHYDFGNWPVELIYEYRKDALSYATILVIIYTYRYLVARHRGEARFVNETEGPAQANPPERMLIKKRGREFIVRTDDIDWVEACGNYVNLHIGERIYPLRETMTGIEARLDGARFARVHRSAIINLDRVSEIRPLDAGDYRIHLISGAEVSFSRRYRARLKSLLGQESGAPGLN